MAGSAPFFWRQSSHTVDSPLRSDSELYAESALTHAMSARPRPHKLPPLHKALLPTLLALALLTPHTGWSQSTPSAQRALPSLGDGGGMNLSDERDLGDRIAREHLVMAARLRPTAKPRYEERSHRDTGQRLKTLSCAGSRAR